MLNSHRAPDGVLGDYCDGELFASSSLFKEDPCALQIQLYYDELEICNPLGSKAKKHKLGIKTIKLNNYSFLTIYCVLHIILFLAVYILYPHVFVIMTIIDFLLIQAWHTIALVTCILSLGLLFQASSSFL